MDVKMTFANLDKMIDSWTADLQDLQGSFQQQSKEIQKFCWRVKRNDSKITCIQTRLKLLQYTCLLVEEDIRKVGIKLEPIEQEIEKLENYYTCYNEVIPSDATRQWWYSLFEGINCDIDWYRNEIESTGKNCTSKEKELLKNPVENLAKIMISFLEMLEHIELKIQHMKNQLTCIDTETKRYSRERGMYSKY